jgi:nicotinamidase-related amidase
MTKDITRRDFATTLLIGGSLSLVALNTASWAGPKKISKGAKNMTKTALLLIDVQNDYFQGGKFPLQGMEQAAQNAAKILAAFRARNMPVIHVRHEDPRKDAPFFVAKTEGAQIHVSVKPIGDEPVVVKQYPNSFRETNLKKILDEKGIGTLLIVGAMSNMCVDAGTRAAADFGYTCAVAHDACAAMEITFNNVTVPPQQVHTAFMGALSFGYAKVATSDELLKDFKLS